MREYQDDGPITKKQAKELAKWLLELQQGSREDAIALVEGLNEEDTTMVIDAIDELAGMQE